MVKDRRMCPFPPVKPRIPSGLNFCKSCSCCHSLCDLHNCILTFCLEDSVFLESSIPARYYIVSSSSSAKLIEPWRDGDDEAIPLRSSCFKGFHCLYIAQLHVSVLILVFCKNNKCWYYLEDNFPWV